MLEKASANVLTSHPRSDGSGCPSERLSSEGLKSLIAEIAVSVFAIGCLWVLARSAALSDRSYLFLATGIAPFVGEFAMTMADRYVLGMPLSRCFERYFWPSRCSCGTVLGQKDIFPVLPLLFRHGRCACRKIKVPLACTWSGLAALMAVLPFFLFSGPLEGIFHLRIPSREALLSMVLLLSFWPMVIADFKHGEVDPALFLFPVAAIVILGSAGFLASLALMLWTPPLLLAFFLIAAAILAAFVTGRLAIGLIDIPAAFCCGFFMTIPQAVSATVWIVIFSVLLLIMIKFAQRFLGHWGFDVSKKYGPDAEHPDHMAIPLIPAIVFGSALALCFPIV